MLNLYPKANSIKYAGNNNISPAVIIVCKKDTCDKSNFFFLNKAEYNAQENMATTIHKSPLLKLRLTNFSRSAFVTITITPNNEKITPSIWYKFVFSIFNIQQKKIIITGIVEIIKTPLITCVKFNE